jgi:hypothetical protein
MDFYNKNIEELYLKLLDNTIESDRDLLYALAQKADDLDFENTNLKLSI